MPAATGRRPDIAKRPLGSAPAPHRRRGLVSRLGCHRRNEDRRNGAANEEWISDLWVLRESRRCGIGRRLLAQGEADIAGRGHRTFQLRVVKSNTTAVNFYSMKGRVGEL